MNEKSIAVKPVFTNERSTTGSFNVDYVTLFTLFLVFNLLISGLNESLHISK